MLKQSFLISSVYSQNMALHLLLVLLIHLTVSAFSLHVALFLLFSELPLLPVVFFFFFFQNQPFVFFFFFFFSPINHLIFLYKSSAAHWQFPICLYKPHLKMFDHGKRLIVLNDFVAIVVLAIEYALGLNVLLVRLIIIHLPVDLKHVEYKSV